MHNHSVKPNAKPEIYLDQVFFEALRHIKKGEEITCDYNEYVDFANIEKPIF